MGKTPLVEKEKDKKKSKESEEQKNEITADVAAEPRSSDSKKTEDIKVNLADQLEACEQPADRVEEPEPEAETSQETQPENIE